MNKAFSISLFIVGIFLIIMGVSAFESFSSDISRFFTGSPTDKAVWLLIAGIAVTIIGLFGFLWKRQKGD